MRGGVLLIPVHDEAARLPPLLASLSALDLEILFVDDGSGDGTGPLLEAWAAGHPARQLLRLDTNRGKSEALRAGLGRLGETGRLARAGPGEVLLLMDGDGQHPPEVLEPLARALIDRGLDMLVATRDLGRYPWIKRLGNRLLTWQARCLTGLPWTDTQSGLRALRLDRAGEVALCLRSGGYTCEQELSIGLARRGWRIANDFSITPGHTRSNSTLGDALRIAWAGFRAWAGSPRDVGTSRLPSSQGRP